MGDIELPLGITGHLHCLANPDIGKGLLGDFHANNTGLSRWDVDDLDARNVFGCFQGCQIQIIDDIHLL